VINLTQPAALHEEFKEETLRSQMAIARTANRLNEVECDLQEIHQQIGNVEAGTRRGFMKLSRESKTSFARLRKEQKSKDMLNLLLVFTITQSVQQGLASHTHAANNQVPVGSTEAPKPLNNGNNDLLTLLLLPSLLSSSDGSGDDSYGGASLLVPLLLFSNK